MKTFRIVKHFQQSPIPSITQRMAAFMSSYHTLPIPIPHTHIRCFKNNRTNSERPRMLCLENFTFVCYQLCNLKTLLKLSSIVWSSKVICTTPFERRETRTPSHTVLIFHQRQTEINFIL